jgi:hypothetical protein
LVDTLVVAQFAIYLSGMILTGSASLVVLTLYRARIVRLMREGAAAEVALPPVFRMRTAVMATRSVAADLAPLANYARTRPRFAVSSELIAGGAAAAILVGGWSAIHGISSWGALALNWLFYLWPAFLAAALLTPRGWLDLKWLVAIYFVVLLAFSIRALLANPGLTWMMLVKYWAVVAGVPTLLAIGTLARPIRAIGPLLFLYFAMCSFGAVFTMVGVGANLAAPEFLPFVLSWIRVGLPVALLPLSVAAIAFIVCGIIGFIPLLVVRWLYERKWQSDLSLAIDSLWFLVAALWAFDMQLEIGAPAFVVGIAAFAAHRLVATLLWRWSRWRFRPPSARPPRLLFLRLFAQGRRRERLLHAVSQGWRYIGSIQMIAGPDLATSSIEPNELLDFLFGRLRSQFLQRFADLELALAKLDERPDPDGRYRTTEFFCTGAFWRQTFQRMLADTDVALLDLRGLNDASSGIRFELEQSRALIPAGRALLLVDGSTDLGLLARALGTTSLEPSNGTPPAPGQPRVLRASEDLGRDASVITGQLAAMAFGYG